ncbi:glutathione S-transferase family protein [Taklimakanibacter deserti]|uniref:glutathione S-transferase family protein n=1 Tax=Taklimakanibacter deserti TaxID=2267839 RepID=UPI000E64FFAA
MKIYGDRNSGNCQKVSITADFLKIPYRWIDIDIMKAESRTNAFLQKSPMGQVPVIELDDGRCLAQSNAIIRYLANGSSLLPDDPFTQAKIDELLFWEQYSHEPYVATSRYHMVYLGRSKDEREPMRVERGEKALDLMEQLIKGRMWFAGDALSVADIALLAYTRLAHEGGFDLTTRPRVMAWIMRAEMALGLPPAGKHEE